MTDDMLPTNAPETMADHAPETTGSTTTELPEVNALPEAVAEQETAAPMAEHHDTMPESPAEMKAETAENQPEAMAEKTVENETVVNQPMHVAEETLVKTGEDGVAHITASEITSSVSENVAQDTAVIAGEDGVAHVSVSEPVSTESNNMIPEVLSKIRSRIDALELQPLETPDNFKAFWSQVKVTNENFKHYSKLIPKEAHEELWKKFDQICERAKQTQEQIKSRFENVSRTKRQAIENAVNEASGLIATDLVKADVLLRKALKFLKDDWNDIKSTLNLNDEELKVRMGREDQDAAWQLWKSTNEHYMTQQQQLRQNNFIAINREVMEMKAAVETGDPFEALTLIKNMQAKLRGMHLPKGDWEEIQNVLREYWDTADKRVKQAKQGRTMERRNKDSIFVVKHQQWITRQESNAQRFKDLIRKNEEVLKNLEEHTEKLKNDLTTAMSDKFKDKIEEWIKEKENKIADIIRTNADLEKRITDIKKKLVEEDSTHENGNVQTESVAEAPMSATEVEETPTDVQA